MRNIKEWTLEELKAKVASWAWQEYTADQIFQWIWQKKVTDFSLMTNIAKSKREFLESNFTISELGLIATKKGSDGTQKFLFSLADGKKIETVFIPEGNRQTVCLSTQVGCPLKCRFCRSGQMAFVRNLKFFEIVDQVLQVEKILGSKMTNVVLMGIGEPLLNLEEVLKACKIINSSIGLNLGARRITISTAGVVEGIYALAKADLRVKLAISLNAPDDDIRSHLMPINKIYPLAEILKAARYYCQKKRSRITFEYVLIKGINDRKEDARRLKKILKGIPCKINLIIFNPFPTCTFKPPNGKTVEKFKTIMEESPFPITLRKSRGCDILAGCGQLACEE